ncbi:NAD(P)-binding protein [Rhizodiscina lignyota]|uniref:NAD(P)-binding protein n=1 Tax=Rhizodiscina lignyota TaxID=1504668 RepID=A0A9P4IDY7_9PEZI|nr:NAD(P)-binding protein [Rhizodiscina lignyota]
MSKPLVLVTGPSGFVGANVFHALLSAGYRVRGTLRSAKHISFLKNKYPAADAAGDISFAIVPDLQAPHALDEAVKDVDYVCHVASPYFTSANDPWAELVLPAVDGTKNVLNSALLAPNLKRVTVLSSFASVVDLEKNPRPGYIYTEKDWDPVTEQLARKDGFWGYHASKTFAERAAWELWAKEKPKWDLVTFCPPMVYGPPIHEVDTSRGIDGLGTSLKRLFTSIMGTDPNFKPNVAVPGLPASVDVRDVAKAHVNALSLPSGVSERFLLSQGVNYFEDGLAGLRAKGEKGLGEPGKKVNTADHFSLDTTQAREKLGIDFIPFQQTVEDTWAAAKELGLISA